MKTYVKIIIVCASGAAVWGLAFCCGIWPNFAIPLASFASGIGMLCGSLTGFSGPKV